MTSDSSPPIVYNYRLATLQSVAAYILSAVSIIIFKFVLSEYSVFQVLFIEGIVCLPFFIALAMIKGGLGKLRTVYPFRQFLRGASQFGCAALGLYGLSYLTPATYTILNYAAPFMIVILARIFLRERCPPLGWAIIVLGFAGVALTAQPKWEGEHIFAMIMVIVSTLFWAINVILTRTMPRDDTITFPFYTILFCATASGLWLLYAGFTSMNLNDLAVVSLGAIATFFGAQLLFASYRHAPLHFTSPFEYSQLAWTVIISYILWAEVPTMLQFIGVAVIAAASLALTFLQEKTAGTVGTKDS